MINKDVILKRVIKIEDKLIVSKILDKAAKSENIMMITHSDFLDPYQKSIVERAFADLKEINYKFEGGYSGAERVIVIFSPNFMSFDEFGNNEIPLSVLHIGVNSRNELTHRDYLGALMALGIKREKIGDILISEESGNIIVIDEIADYIKYNLDKIGNSKVAVEIKELNDIFVPEQKVKEIRTTVSALRLDCISSAGFGISRSKTAEYIKADKVSLNWESTENLSKQVKEGDTISIKGKGRVVLETIDKVTKKGRTAITMKKFI
jgi:RNA-binding protein YlmH